MVADMDEKDEIGKAMAGQSLYLFPDSLGMEGDKTRMHHKLLKRPANPNSKRNKMKTGIKETPHSFSNKQEKKRAPRSAMKTKWEHGAPSWSSQDGEPMLQTKKFLPSRDRPMGYMSGLSYSSPAPSLALRRSVVNASTLPREKISTSIMCRTYDVRMLSLSLVKDKVKRKENEVEMCVRW